MAPVFLFCVSPLFFDFLALILNIKSFSTRFSAFAIEGCLYLGPINFYICSPKPSPVEDLWATRMFGIAFAAALVFGIAAGGQPQKKAQLPNYVNQPKCKIRVVKSGSATYARELRSL